MNRFRWGNINDPKIFMDYNSIRTTNILGIRGCFSRLAVEYAKQGNPEKKELKYYNSLGDRWKKGVEYERWYAEYVVQQLIVLL